MNASITVVHSSGRQYSANNLQVLRKGWGSDHQQVILAFECSGVLTTFDAQDIVRLDYHFIPEVVSAVAKE